MIEDLEFQLEEHKLGVNEKLATSCEQQQQQPQEPDYLNQATEGILNQLKIEQDISKNHLVEISFLKEQIEVKENEIKNFKESEQNFEIEREKYRKSLNDFELELGGKAMQSSLIDELNEEIKRFEQQIRSFDENRVKNEELLSESESKRSELQFLFDELSIKFSDQEASITKKFKEQIDSLEFTIEEQSVNLNDFQVLNEKNEAKIRELEESLEEYKKANADFVSCL